jgi:phospholipase C
MPSPNVELITTVVVVMMENRSFDHLLGYLSLKKGWEKVDGVRPGDPAWIKGTTNAFGGQTYIPFEQKDVVHKMAGDPPHEWTDIARQMGQPDAVGVFPMNGFVENYANAKEKPPIGHDPPPPVMGYFTGEHLPVTDRLATNFAVCDHWFSSLPAGTQANRLMSMAGYSLIAHNTFPLPNQSLVYDWLDEREVNWRVYHEGLPFFSMMPNQIGRILTSGRFKPLADLWDDANNEGPDEFPEVIFVEPWYTDGPHHNLSRDDHAPSSVVGGQQFLNEVYRSIRINPNWLGTVMVVNYDEHGGFFDHVSPPPVLTPAPDNAHSNPGFAYLGVRVPGLIVSPFVSPGWICDKRLDHTSVLKLLGQKFGNRNGKPKGYSPLVDTRDVHSVYDVLDLAAARTQNPPVAFPLTDEFLNQPLPAAGYIPSSSVPPSILAQAFKFGLDTIRNHPLYTDGRFDDLLAAFPADPAVHLT